MSAENSKNMKNENNIENLRGIKIHHINLVMMLITCVVYIPLIIHTIRAYDDFDKLGASTKNYISCQQAAIEAREASDYLTEQVRCFAATGDIAYVNAYFEEAETTRRRDEALDKLMEAGAGEKQEKELREALRYSNELMGIEYYSMRLAVDAYGVSTELLPEAVRNQKLKPEDSLLGADEKEALAIQLVLDSQYHEYKDRIYEHLDELINTVLTLTEKQMSGAELELSDSLMRQRVMITILLITSVLMYICITQLVVRPLRVYIRNIQNETMIDVVGAYEFKYLALVYNNIFELNAENRAYLKYRSEHGKLTGVMNWEAFDGFAKIYSRFAAQSSCVICCQYRWTKANCRSPCSSVSGSGTRPETDWSKGRPSARWKTWDNISTGSTAAMMSDCSMADFSSSAFCTVSCQGTRVTGPSAIRSRSENCSGVMVWREIQSTRFV